MTDHLIAPQELDALIRGAGARRPPVVLDVRWRLGGPDGHPLYLDGHVPGAVYVALDRELAAHGDPAEGRHPLPSAAAFEASKPVNILAAAAPGTYRGMTAVFTAGSADPSYMAAADSVAAAARAAGG